MKEEENIREPYWGTWVRPSEMRAILIKQAKSAAVKVLQTHGASKKGQGMYVVRCMLLLVALN
jgi:hypothetical protein